MSQGNEDYGLPRKLTAIGTAGDNNQLFTVYESNWSCRDCGQENYARRPRCFRCKKQKPEGLNNIVMDPAYEALKSGKEQAWQEVVDPTSFQIYYHNKLTGHTQWERPVEMGQAPLATGWFGRGQAGSNVAQSYLDRNTRFLTRPAKKQKDFVDPRSFHTEGANEYNIWYGKYLGDMSDRGADRDPATDRCHLDQDAGYTKADTGSSAQKSSRLFCIHFARGVCAKGAECTYYHRAPSPEDDRLIDEMIDCFGRSRHNSHKSDMSGVGSFMKPCRTLFVGNLLKAKYQTPKALEDALWRHFGEWGELESLNVIYRLSIAFPRYRLRTSAEFAKEAMHNQQLDQGEILCIKWAHDDPNPVAKEAIERADRDAMLSLLNAKGISTEQSAAFNYPADYQVPPAKRLRRDDDVDDDDDDDDATGIRNGGSGGGGDASVQDQSSAAALVSYPDTDHQYDTAVAGRTTQDAVTSSGSSSGDILPVVDADAYYRQHFSHLSPEEYKSYCDQYYAQQTALARLGIDSTTTTSSSSSSSSSNPFGASSAVPVPVSLVAAAGTSKKETKKRNRSSNDEEEESSASAVAEEDSGSIIAGEKWQKYKDETTGAYYFFNSITGESSWTLPSKA